VVSSRELIRIRLSSPSLPRWRALSGHSWLRHHFRTASNCCSHFRREVRCELEVPTSTEAFQSWLVLQNGGRTLRDGTTARHGPWRALAMSGSCRQDAVGASDGSLGSNLIKDETTKFTKAMVNVWPAPSASGFCSWHEQSAQTYPALRLCRWPRWRSARSAPHKGAGMRCHLPP
jgi:hypothetical protein